MFDRKEFLERLAIAHAALADAQDLLDRAAPADRFDVLRRINLRRIIEMMGPVLGIQTEWRHIFREGRTKL